ncbi:uncharacterized protein LOC115888774 isoform X2 [Sitophilus oryzae]|uniref:Uncharacterized protein LOC115888774 isoform X2 n=1 Tax=Sitophilus oryzae TaxID=7048 RepID=A0A6J2YNV7_SITOR|nr:uncharacterized protein LOC115888774 isoform X2 [Sitophilus oryzae]
MNISSVRSLERNSRLTLAIAKNRAEENQLKVELGYLDNEKKTALRILQNDRISFKTKYSKSTMLNDSSNSLNDTLNKYYVPADFGKNEEIMGFNIPKSKHSFIAFEQIHNMLFTNEEVDVDKILCLHLISAHRTESLQPPKRPSAVMCKIHSPLERLLDRSKRKHIHLEQKMTSILPIYTLETEAERFNTPINDGRLATRLLLNEKIRELINTVLNALRQSNPEKNYEIFEMANDISVLKKTLYQKAYFRFLGRSHGIAVDKQLRIVRTDCTLSRQIHAARDQNADRVCGTVREANSAECTPDTGTTETRNLGRREIRTKHQENHQVSYKNVFEGEKKIYRRKCCQRCGILF